MTFSDSEMAILSASPLRLANTRLQSDTFDAAVRFLNCANSCYFFGAFLRTLLSQSWSKTCNRVAVTLEILWLFFGGVLGVIAACAIPFLFTLLRRVIELRGRAVSRRPTPKRERQ